jgi:hypothetical protein
MAMALSATMTTPTATGAANAPAAVSARKRNVAAPLQNISSSEHAGKSRSIIKLMVVIIFLVYIHIRCKKLNPLKAGSARVRNISQLPGHVNLNLIFKVS